MTAGAAATGMRAWLGAHSPSWMTPRRLKAITAVVLLVAVLAAGSSLAPSGSDTTSGSAAAAPSQAQR